MSNISTLKSLTQTTFDSVEGYRKAIDKAEDRSLKDALSDRMQKRENTLEKLNTTLSQQGEDTITSASTSASAHQTWINIADSFSNGNEAAAERVEEGEDYIAGKFRDALEDEDLTGEVRSVVEQACNEIQQAEKFSDMLEREYA